MARTRIVIIGGGFGGVKCAQTLRRELRRTDLEVVLFNRENHLVFSPLLADAVGSSLSLQDVIVPLRQLLPDVVCRTEEVLNVDLTQREIEYSAHDGSPARFAYDHVVIAAGAISNLNVVPGMADHAYPLKTVGDAAALRTHVLQQLERAEVCDDPVKRRWYLSFIVVGGAYSGVEAAGEINDLVRGSLRFFHHIRAEEVSVTLIHSRDQLLPEISPQLREFAREKMQAAGVTMMLNARVNLATGEGVGTQDGFVSGGTIVCTIGSAPAPFVERMDSPKEKGRLLTEPDLRLRGRSEAWAIGDCAHIINGHDGQSSPPTGQFAERQGRQCAQNLARVVRGEATHPFSFRVLGQLCSIGGHSAVAEMFGFRLSGFWAWFTWRGVYLFKLPSWGRRIQVGADWAWLLLFPRDLAYIRTDPTERVTHAHYQTGDYIFKQGDPAANFYVIESGEVEIVRTSPEHPEGELIAVLGPGNFFGEQALLNNRPRSASIRARSTVEVVVMGRHVFTTISKSLAPLRDALTSALTRRAGAFMPENAAIVAQLRSVPLSDLIEPAPQPFLAPTATLREVAHTFATTEHEVLLVAGPEAHLLGLLTLTDFLQARARDLPPDTPVTDFMVKNPVAITAQDTALVAASIIREQGHKLLPILADSTSRRIVGLLRARKLLARLLAPSSQH